MKTAGYDIVLLLNEHFLNQVSGAMFYNNFLTFNDSKDFKLFKWVAFQSCSWRYC